LRRKTTHYEVRRYFQDWLDTAFQNGLINRNDREETLSRVLNQLSAIVAGLNDRGIASVGLRAGPLKLFLREGRDPTYRGFSLFEIQWPRKRQPKRRRRLRCFLGHRFLKSISNSLRLNLRYVLEPSRIDLIVAGMDIAAVGFFDDIVKKIRSCDFCIFDNRRASEKPNVYIEAGIAYALKKPFILANFSGNRLGVPSDLTHILNIPYKSYEDLCRTLYFHLPVFLKASRLRQRRRNRA
jgi:hypothetical protein